MKNEKSILRVLLTVIVVAALCISLISCDDLIGKITGSGSGNTSDTDSGSSNTDTGSDSNIGNKDDNSVNDKTPADKDPDSNTDNGGNTDTDPDKDEDDNGNGNDNTDPEQITVSVGEIAYEFYYSGKAHEPTPIITSGGRELSPETDYSLTYTDNVNAGTATVTVSFTGEFTGIASVERSFTILPKDASGASVTVADIVLGNTPGATIEFQSFTFTEEDYDISYGDYSAVSDSVTATVTFKGNFTGSVSTEFAVIHAIEATPTVTLLGSNFVYSGNAHEPWIIVTVGENELTVGFDYTVTYENNVNAGTATLTVNLIGDYRGSESVSFTIAKRKVDLPTLPDSVYLEYDGTQKTLPLLYSDYCVAEGHVNTNAGDYTATVSLKDTENTVWKDGTNAPKTFEYSINALEIKELTVNVTITKPGVKPEVSVSHPTITLTDGIDYIIDYGNYAANNTSQVTVTLIGNYSGSFVKSYTVPGNDAYLESHFDFNYDLKDNTGNHTADMVGSDPAASFIRADYSGAIHTVGGRSNIVKIHGINLGTNDFTFFTSVRFDTADITDGTNQGNAIIESGSHSQYNCDGTNKNNCPLCNGSALSEYQFDCISIALVKNEYGGSYPYRLRVQIGKEYMSYLLTSMEVYYLTQGEYMDIAVTVDRRYSVSGNTDVTRVVLYFDGNKAATRDFNLGIDQTLGSDAIYLGGNLEWTSGGGIKYRDKYIDTFRLYNGALTEDDIWKIPTDTGSESQEKDWYVDDILIGTADIKTQGNQYGSIEKYVSVYFTVKGDTDGLETLTLAQNYENIFLYHYIDEDLYNLVITGNAAAAVKNGLTVKVKSGNSVRDINIIFNEVTSITSTDLYLYSIGFTSTSGNKYEKFYFDILDQDGRPVTGLTVRCDALGVGPSFGYDKDEGRWFIEITENQAENRIFNTTRGYVTASFYAEDNDSLSTSINIYYHKPYAGGSSAHGWTNNTDQSSYIIFNETLGTKTWTIGMSINLPHINTGDTIDLFSTTGRDASKGITLSIKAKSADMWSARLRIDGVTLWYESISLHYYENHTVAIILEIDRTEYGKIVTRLYYDSEENEISSSTKYVSSTDTLDYDTSSVSGYVPECQIVFGGMNTTLTQADGGTISSPEKCKDYDLWFNDIIVVEGLGHEAVNHYL